MGAGVALGLRIGVVGVVAATLLVVPANLLGPGGRRPVQHVVPAEAQADQEEAPFPLGDQGAEIELVLQPGVAPVGDLEGVEGDPHADAAHVVVPEVIAPLLAAVQALGLQKLPEVGGVDLLHLQNHAGQVQGGEAQPLVPRRRQEHPVAGETELRLAVGETDLPRRRFPGAGAPAAADAGMDFQLVGASVGELPVDEDLLPRSLQADRHLGPHLDEPLDILAQVQLVGEPQGQPRVIPLLFLLDLLQPHLLQRGQGDLLSVLVGDLQSAVVYGQLEILPGRIPPDGGAGEGENLACRVPLPVQVQQGLSPAQGHRLPHLGKTGFFGQLEAAPVDQVAGVVGGLQVEIPFEREDFAAGYDEGEVQGLQACPPRQEGGKIEAAPVLLARRQGPVGAKDQLPGRFPQGHAVYRRVEGEHPLLQGVAGQAGVDRRLYKPDSDGVSRRHRSRRHRADQPGGFRRHRSRQVLHRLPGATQGQGGHRQEAFAEVFGGPAANSLIPGNLPSRVRCRLVHLCLLRGYSFEPRGARPVPEPLLRAI